jgi:hypothetical protein
MFHCHVEDHMEAGMMAVYTIYKPSTRACPLTVAGGEFWKHPETMTLNIKNTSGKPIRSVKLISEMLLAPQDLRRPYNFEWSLNDPLLPDQEKTLEKPGSSATTAQSVLGWVFFPSMIKFEDGTSWQPESEGECFGVVWRDRQHPELPVLPTRQFELNPD